MHFISLAVLSHKGVVTSFAFDVVLAYLCWQTLNLIIHYTLKCDHGSLSCYHRTTAVCCICQNHEAAVHHVLVHIGYVAYCLWLILLPFRKRNVLWKETPVAICFCWSAISLLSVNWFVLLLHHLKFSHSLVFTMQVVLNTVYLLFLTSGIWQA